MELFAVLAPKSVEVPDFPPVERLDQEAAVLGVYLSGHPVDRYVQALKPFQQLTAVADFEVNSRVTTVLVVRRIKSIRTKKKAKRWRLSMDKMGLAAPALQYFRKSFNACQS